MFKKAQRWLRYVPGVAKATEFILSLLEQLGLKGIILTMIPTKCSMVGHSHIGSGIRIFPLDGLVGCK